MYRYALLLSAVVAVLAATSFLADAGPVWP